MINNSDAQDAQPKLFTEKVAEVKNSHRAGVGLYQVSIARDYSLEEMLNFISSTILKDRNVSRYLSGQVTHAIENFKEMYKAFVKEAKELEKKKDYQGAFNRVAKAKLLQEELFKNMIPKAKEEIRKCDEWLSKLRMKSID